MAQLQQRPVSEMHLLCLMELWFDGSQTIVKALADFNYSTQFDGLIACPFCDKEYDESQSYRIMTGQIPFRHYVDCPALLARQLRASMIVDTGEAEDDGYEDDEMSDEHEDDIGGDGTPVHTSAARPVQPKARFIARQLAALRRFTDLLAGNSYIRRRRAEQL